jgi:hypothetical protein
MYSHNPHQIVRLLSAKDDLQEWQIKELYEMLNNPIGAKAKDRRISRSGLHDIRGVNQWLGHALGT